MDQQTVDKVLQLLRDGASAASGAAKEGFQQVCAYRASVAGVWVVLDIVIPIVALVMFLTSIIFILKSKDADDPSFMAGTMALVTGLLFAMSSMLLLDIPKDYATMKNPAGAVLNDIIGGRR